MDVAVVTDSTAYLPPDVVARHGIRVVPLQVVVGGKPRLEGVDITTAEVAAALRSFTPVSTSRPSPQTLLHAYEEAAAAGARAVVSIHLSSAMSGTVESAMLAAAQSPIPVEVVDSRSLGMGMGYAVLSAAAAARAGADAQTVAAVARSRSAATTAIFYVDTLEYLRRGGRIGAASALLGSALAIKPLLALRDGQIQPIERVRTSARALSRMEDLAVRAAEDAGGCGFDVAVHHLDSARRATAFADRLRSRLARPSATDDPSVRDQPTRLEDTAAGEPRPEASVGQTRPGAAAGNPAAEAAFEDRGPVEVPVVELGAVVGAHVGPGMIAVVVSPRPREGG